MPYCGCRIIKHQMLSACWHRLLQTPEGRYYIGPSGEPTQIPCITTQKPHFHLSDLPSKYAEQHISDFCPSNTLLPEFILQLQPHLMLTGRQALFQVQLTQVQGGSVLGISFSHGLSGLYTLLPLCTVEPCLVVMQAAHQILCCTSSFVTKWSMYDSKDLQAVAANHSRCESIPTRVVSIPSLNASLLHQL